MEKQFFHIFTDGGCEPTNPGPCGYAFVETLGRDDTHEILSFAHYIGEGTNNIAEISAIKAALEHLHNHKEYYLSNPENVVTIYPDSTYAINCITLWYHVWVKKRQLYDKKNVPLIKDTVTLLLDARKLCTINFEWVKGHSGIFGNERCDVLASDAIANKLHNSYRHPINGLNNVNNYV